MTDRQWSVGSGRDRVFFDAFGVGPTLEIVTPRGSVRFDFSNMFGPLPVTREGRERNIAHNHPFWRAVSLWSRQGKKVTDGIAIWHEPKQPITDCNNVILEDGEPGWDW